MQNAKRITSKARFDRALYNLKGVLHGISFDSVINEKELDYLRVWLGDQKDFRNEKPMQSLCNAIDLVLADGKVTLEERDDLLSLVSRFESGNPFYDSVTAKIQELHGVTAGITCDHEINEIELANLKSWLNKHSELKGLWPFDEIYTLALRLSRSPRDKKIQSDVLMRLSTFSKVDGQMTVDMSMLKVSGVCSTDPEITMTNKVFCLTGESSKFTRPEYAELIHNHGGTFKDGISKAVDYLVVCADGSDYWAYECYGRKIELAMELRKKGNKLLLVHEFDLLDCLRDLGVAV